MAGKKYGSKTINIDISSLDRLTKELAGFEKELNTATRNALNRTIDQVVTQTARLVTQNYAIKTNKVKESFKGGIKRPSQSDLSASIRSSGHTLSFAHFPYSPKKPKRNKASTKSIFANAVMVKIKESRGQVLSKKGFVASTGARSADKTQYNVFKRLGTFSVATKGRYKGQLREDIAPIRTLSIPQMITVEKVGEQIEKFAADKFSERLEHEIMREVMNIGKKVKGRG